MMKPITIPLQVLENDAENLGDGGRVLFGLPTADAAAFYESPTFITAANVVINFRRDDPMTEFPVSKPDRQRRRFELVLREVEP